MSHQPIVFKSILFIVLLFTASVAWAAPVDVTDYGAVGDGVADDGPEIQAAIDSFQISLTGGTVYFPPGLYNVSNTIYVPSNIRLQGTGSTLYNTQIRLMLPQRALFEVTNKGANNVVFKDLLLISMVNAGHGRLRLKLHSSAPRELSAFLSRHETPGLATSRSRTCESRSSHKVLRQPVYRVSMLKSPM